VQHPDHHGAGILTEKSSQSAVHLGKRFIMHCMGHPPQWLGGSQLRQFPNHVIASSNGPFFVFAQIGQKIWPSDFLQEGDLVDVHGSLEQHILNQ